jgi:hypothetical protein
VVGAHQPGAERFDGATVLLAIGDEVGKVVVEGAVDHAFRQGGPATQAVRVLQVAAMRFRTGGLQCPGARVRARHAEHPVPRPDEFRDDGRADETGRAGNEDTHGSTPVP